MRDEVVGGEDDEALMDRLRSSFVVHPDKPEETPESTFRALYFAAAGIPMSAKSAMAAALPSLDRVGRATLRHLIERRCAGIPLAHLTGRRHFMGLEMLAGAHTLIPRVETELLGYEALRLLTSLVGSRGEVTVLDICTGSGNLALALAAHESRCKVFASDLSADAISFARKNAQHLGLEARIEFRQGDLFGAFRSSEFLNNVDLIVCNPPYISTQNIRTLHPEISQHEPHMAFDGGSLGISVLRKLVREAGDFLRPSSYLCFEVGRGQGKTMVRSLQSLGKYCEVRTLTDSGGHVRALVAKI